MMKITIEVSEQELENALYGSLSDLGRISEKIFDRVLEEAKKQGFKER